MQFFKNIVSSLSEGDLSEPKQTPNTKPVEQTKKIEAKPIPEPRPKKKLLVIESTENSSYTDLFSGQIVNGFELEVIVAGWHSMQTTTYFESERSSKVIELYIDIIVNNRKLTIKPDFILCRNEVKQPSPGRNFQNQLFAMMYSNVPSVNSLHSIYCFLERPIVFAELIKIRMQHGFDKFPLISQTYYPGHFSMNFAPEFPVVVKVGHAHAGMGKMVISDAHQFEDFASVMALDTHYITAEHFLQGEYDLRIQKIGNHYRAFRRYSISGNWKTNTGSSMLEQIELTDQYRFWVDEASKIFGGLDILALDAIHTHDGKEYILEVNGGSIGLNPETEDEDLLYIRDLVMEKMRQVF